MQRVMWICRAMGSGLMLLAMAPAALAGPVHEATGGMGQVLLAKSWLVGYVIFGLAVLLGMLAVLIPAMRKGVRKKSN